MLALPIGPSMELAIRAQEVYTQDISSQDLPIIESLPIESLPSEPLPIETLYTPKGLYEINLSKMINTKRECKTRPIIDISAMNSDFSGVVYSSSSIDKFDAYYVYSERKACIIVSKTKDKFGLMNRILDIKTLEYPIKEVIYSKLPNKIEVFKRQNDIYISLPGYDMIITNDGKIKLGGVMTDISSISKSELREITSGYKYSRIDVTASNRWADETEIFDYLLSFSTKNLSIVGSFNIDVEALSLETKQKLSCVKSLHITDVEQRGCTFIGDFVYTGEMGHERFLFEGLTKFRALNMDARVLEGAPNLTDLNFVCDRKTPNGIYIPKLSKLKRLRYIGYGSAMRINGLPNLEYLCCKNYKVLVLKDLPKLVTLGLCSAASSKISICISKPILNNITTIIEPKLSSRFGSIGVNNKTSASIASAMISMFSLCKNMKRYIGVLRPEYIESLKMCSHIRATEPVSESVFKSVLDRDLFPHISHLYIDCMLRTADLYTTAEKYAHNDDLLKCINIPVNKDGVFTEATKYTKKQLDRLLSGKTIDKELYNFLDYNNRDISSIFYEYR